MKKNKSKVLTTLDVVPDGLYPAILVSVSTINGIKSVRFVEARKTTVEPSAIIGDADAQLKAAGVLNRKPDPVEIKLPPPPKEVELAVGMRVKTTDGEIFPVLAIYEEDGEVLVQGKLCKIVLQKNEIVAVLPKA